MTRSTRRVLLVSLIVGLVIISSACSCSNLFEKIGLGGRAPETGETTGTRTAATTAPSPTPPPTEIPVVTGQGLDSIPSESGAEFTITATEAEINAYIADQELSQQGVEVRDIKVYLRDGELACDVKVKYEEMGLDLGLTVFGTLDTYEGDIYAIIDQVELDDSVSGLVKLMAQKVIEQALADYSGEHGIQIPIEGYTFDSVELRSGLITISGRTK